MNQASDLPSIISVDEYTLPEVIPDHLDLSLPEIHVWQRQRSLSAPELAQMADLLADDELDRARKFRFDKDRDEFVESRGTLRRLLSAYTDISPRQIRFHYTQYARPMLPETLDLDFNVSHSSGLILWAFARGRRIGVDVEKSRRDFNTLEIAERFFSVIERQTLRALPEEHRREAFFRCWTRKESFIKAFGEGLSHPLDCFDVSLAPGATAQLVATRPDPMEAKRWAMWDLEVPDGYAAALVGELK